MITVQNSTYAFIGTPDGEVGLTNYGTWHFGSVSYVAGWTNSPVDTTGVRDGSIIVVDSAGLVTIAHGADLWGAATIGFALCAATCGSIMGFRYLMRMMHGLAGLPHSGTE